MSKTAAPQRSGAKAVLSLPPKWLHMYDEFIAKNAGQVSQIESALRSLTYVIPGKLPPASPDPLFPLPPSRTLDVFVSEGDGTHNQETRVTTH